LATEAQVKRNSKDRKLFRETAGIDALLLHLWATLFGFFKPWARRVEPSDLPKTAKSLRFSAPPLLPGSSSLVAPAASDSASTGIAPARIAASGSSSTSWLAVTGSTADSTTRRTAGVLLIFLCSSLLGQPVELAK
jgi:hypothetical protein